QHLPQPLQTLPRVARLTEGGLYGLVLRREVGRHDPSRNAGPERVRALGRIPPVLKVWLDGTPRNPRPARAWPTGCRCGKRPHAAAIGTRCALDLDRIGLTTVRRGWRVSLTFHVRPF